MARVTLLDVVLLASFSLAVVSGYRRGALLQILAYAGLAGGLVLGAVAAPHVAALATGRVARAALALGTLFVGGAIGDGTGWLIGHHLRARARGTVLRRADAAGGSIVSAVAVFAATWFLALNLVNGPFPTIARQIRDSSVVRAIDAVMPAPPPLVGEVRRVLGVLGFPDAFVGLPPLPADPVPLPTDEQALRAFRAARGATVRIDGDGCGGVLAGSGFVVEPGYVVTNAHVIAGVSSIEVRTAEGGAFAAIPVLFDGDLDIAVLRVAGLDVPGLGLTGTVAARGASGATLGYPEGGALAARKAAVRQSLLAVGRDIYGGGEVTRRLLELQAVVRPGNSGGPFVLPSGEVAGVVFAASTTDPRIGYAIASTEVESLARRAVGRSAPVATGACAA
jgi:S1-C subfamily serine protease